LKEFIGTVFAPQTEKLVSKWNEELEKNLTGIEVNISLSMSALTLDIIGLSALLIDFDSISDQPSGNKLSHKYMELVETISPNVLMLLPFYDMLPLEREKKKKKISSRNR